MEPCHFPVFQLVIVALAIFVACCFALVQAHSPTWTMRTLRQAAVVKVLFRWLAILGPAAMCESFL